MRCRSNRLWPVLRTGWLLVLASQALNLQSASGPMPEVVLPARQVHLDFHTSPDIPGVGARFDPRQWQEALRLGHVNWINIFAKCHHSWSYYPTKIGQKHPSLQIDLLGQQIAACHELGIKCPIYYTVGWSAAEAEQHPEWCVRNQDGSIAARNWDGAAQPGDPRPANSWKFLCPSGQYLHLMLSQVEEICIRYLVDGFFFDICNVSPPCYCATCRQGMQAAGIAIDDDRAVAEYNARKWKRFFQEARRVITKYRPLATVFFNGTTKLIPEDLQWDMAARNTEQQLEDLPTTWGGYDKLPLRAKFFHNTGKPIVAMSGKFHTSWGEFGGFKHRDAIRYEAAAMIAFGAACNFGDQLHPSGEMDLETYRNLGYAYEYVEQIEAYGIGGRPVSRLGLLRTGSAPDDEGVSTMLMEIHQDYVVADPARDWSGLETIILTGAAGLTRDLADKLAGYVRQGGSLLVLGESALDADKKGFLLDVGATYLGPAKYQEDYLVVGPALAREMVSTPFLNYQAALRVELRPGTEILARLQEPYFDRTYAHYCSHQNTPYQLGQAAHPGAIRFGSVVFLPHRLGEIYYKNGARLHRQLFANALALVYRHPMLQVDRLPSAGRVSLLHQPQAKRYVAHLLYGPPLQRGRCLVIEDLPAVENVAVEIRVPEAIKRAYSVPGKQSLAIRRSRGTAAVKVPKFSCHTAVVFEY